MRKLMIMACFVGISTYASAESVASLLKVPTGRPGVTMNAIVVDPGRPFDTILLLVPGTPGSWSVLKYESADNWQKHLSVLGGSVDLFANAGIALVSMGCPSDHWGGLGSADCGDDYRQSQEYADDASEVIQVLRERYKVNKIYLFGHSSGTISAKWLGLHLPDQLAGTISASAMTQSYGGLAHSVVHFDMNAIKIPVLNIHHEDDHCPSTPYATVRDYSHDNLVTVRGGVGSAVGDLCRLRNHHGFEGQQRGVALAIIKWIRTGQVQQYVDDDGPVVTH